MSDEPPRFNVLGVAISAITQQSAFAYLQKCISEGRRGYVVVSAVHGVVEARRDSEYRAKLNRSLLTTPDGMPLVWLGQQEYGDQVSRVYGPDLMLNICKATAGTDATHYFYGGAEGVAQELAANMEKRFPGLNVIGTHTPPFRELTEEEELELEKELAEKKPTYFWVGLGTPKQENFMARYSERFDAQIMLGVGAAFDFHTGRIPQAPAWMQKCGLEWLFRLCSEPRRLWKRYLGTNPDFLWHVFLQKTGLKKFGE